MKQYDLKGPRPARFGKQYFVHFDNAVIGGRWFEAKIKLKSNGYYDVTFHDGDRGTYTTKKISKLGEKSEKGDVVLSYRTGSDMRYAFKGQHTNTEGNKILVKYDDGVTKLEEKTKVHKLVTLYSLQIKGSFQIVYLHISQFSNIEYLTNISQLVIVAKLDQKN